MSELKKPKVSAEAQNELDRAEEQFKAFVMGLGAKCNQHVKILM